MCQRVRTSLTELTEEGVISSDRMREVSRRHSTCGISSVGKKKKRNEEAGVEARKARTVPRVGG